MTALDELRAALTNERQWNVFPLTPERKHRADTDAALARVEAELERLGNLAAPPKCTCAGCQQSFAYHDMYRCYDCQLWFDSACMGAHMRTTFTGSGRARLEALEKELPALRKRPTLEQAVEALRSVDITYTGRAGEWMASRDVFRAIRALYGEAES